MPFSLVYVLFSCIINYSCCLFDANGWFVLPYERNTSISPLTDSPHSTNHHPALNPYPANHHPALNPYPANHHPALKPYPANHHPALKPYPANHHPALKPYPANHHPALNPYPYTVVPVQTRNIQNVKDKDRCLNDTLVVDNLLRTYNRLETPQEGRFSRSPVQVKVHLWIQTITQISDRKSEFYIDLYINEIWTDPSLSFSNENACKRNITIGNDLLGRLWTPNTCFVNSKNAGIHYSPFPNIWIMLFENGTVWLNYRMNVSGPCQFNLAKFPMDSVSCHLTFESFNYNNQEVSMSWREDEPVKFWMHTKRISMADYDLTHIRSWANETLYKAGYWDELTIQFSFRRRAGWYVIQAYVPSLLTIFVSWISFYLGIRAIPARTMICVHSLLALFSQFGSIIRNLPRVSYVKAIDVWMLSCSGFVFGTLLELAVVAYISAHRYAINPIVVKSMTAKEQAAENYISAVAHQDDLAMTSNHVAVVRRKLAGVLDGGGFVAQIVAAHGEKIHKELLDKIDRRSAIGFPLCFFLFNMIYWIYYLKC